jgi:hypothetical protein
MMDKAIAAVLTVVIVGVCGLVTLVASFAALYLFLAPFAGSAGAAGLVALTSALIAVATLALASQRRVAAARAFSQAAEAGPASYLSLIKRFVLSKPVASALGAMVSAVVLTRNPRLIAAVLALLSGTRDRSRK